MTLQGSCLKFSNHRKRGIFIFLIIISVLVPAAFNLTPDLYSGAGEKNISVKIEYKGSYEKDIEKLINRLEQPLSAITELTSIFSVSESEKGTLYCSFSDSKNYDEAYMEVRDCVNRIYSYFPDNVQRPVLSRSGVSNSPVFAASFPLTSSFKGFFNSKSLKKEFEEIKGCSEVEIGGLKDKEIIVIPNSEKIITSPFKISDIINCIRGENFSLVITPSGRNQIKTGKRIKNENDINQLFLDKGLKLSDYASANEKERNQESSGRINGEKNIILYAYKGGGSRVIEVCKNLKKKTEELGGNVIFSKGNEIEKALSETMMSVAAGIAAVIISALFYFKQIYSSIFVILNILFSISSSAAVLRFSGCTLNIISLSGIAVVSGLAIDNSIIVLEKFKVSDSDIRLTIKDTFNPLLFSFLTTSAVFIPILFASEKLKIMFKGMIVSVTSGLIASFLFTFYFIPLFLHTKQSPSTVLNQNNKDKSSEKIYTHFNKSKKLNFRKISFQIIKALSIKKRTPIIVIIILVLFSTILLLNISYKPFSFQNTKRLTFFMEFPAGTRFDHVEKKALSVEKSILEDKTLSVTLKVEKERARYDIKGMSANSIKKTKNKINRISSDYRNIYFHFPSVESAVNSYDINIYSRNMEFAAKDAYKLGEIIKSENSGLEVIYHFKEPAEGLNVIINTKKAESINTSAASIDRYIYTTLTLPVISKYFSGNTEKDIRIGSDKIYSPDELIRLPISPDRQTSAVQGWKRLGDIADLKSDYPPNRIYHRNRQRVLSLSVSGKRVDPAVMEKTLSSFDFNNACRGEGGSLYKEKRKETEELIFLIILSFFFILTVLVIQFESLKIPVLISYGIPSSFALPLAVMKIFIIPFSISTALALILSAGICVNNAILVLSPFKGKKRCSLNEVSTSLSEKGGAMITASFTTVLSITPLFFTGANGILAPFSITLASGIAGSLITVPVILAAACINEKIPAEN